MPQSDHFHMVKTVKIENQVSAGKPRSAPLDNPDSGPAWEALALAMLIAAPSLVLCVILLADISRLPPPRVLIEL